MDAQDDEEHVADVVTAFTDQLEGQTLTTEHGEEAVIRVFSVLVENGSMETSDLREQLYPEFGNEFASAESMWQSINRYFGDLD